MTKKNYEAAARIAQAYHEDTRHAVVGAFELRFRADNPRFDEARFRAACVPGANVKARGHMVNRPSWRFRLDDDGGAA